MSTLGIFAAPREPFFNHQESGISRAVLQDWLLELKDENAKNVETSKKSQDSFKSPKHVDLIYKTCDKMKMSSQVKLLAVEIFSRFMIKHVEELYRHVATCSSKTKMSDWEKILDRIGKQQALRIASCCQLASKLTSHYKMITACKCRRYLRELGHHYTPESILQSELRVLKTLNFKLAIISPLIYVDTLLEVMGYNDKEIDVKMYYATAVKILLLFNLKQMDLKRKLMHYVSGTEQHRVKRVRDMMKDMMLVGTAVIIASVFIMDRDSTDKIVDHLSMITKIPSDNIVDFATAIIALVQEGNLPKGSTAWPQC